MTENILDIEYILSIKDIEYIFLNGDFKTAPPGYGFIYMIECSNNGKKYIGQTIRTLEFRWRQHLYYGKRCIEGSKKPQHNTKIYHAMRKHGLDTFSIKPLLLLSKHHLDYMEIKLIKYFDTMNPLKGYNMTEGGNVHKMTEELKNNVSIGTRKAYEDINNVKKNA
jgi:hypothetical protein